MKKKLMLKLLSFAMVISMAGTMFPSNIRFVSAEEENVEKSIVLEDGINDAWTQDESSVVGTGAVCAVEDGWLHLKADAGNGNNPGSKPAMFVNPNEFDFDQAGYFEFTMKTNNANTSASDCDRFGIYLGYDTDKNGMYLGYDDGGWFWQKYQNGGGNWYSGGRTAAPSKGQEVAVRIEWTADHKATLSVGGKTVFNQEDFSGISGILSNKIAIKAGSFVSGVPTDVLLKNIHYTGQKEAATYALTGKVVDAKGNPIEGATVKLAGETVQTGADGTYAFNVIAGTYTVAAIKAGYEAAEIEVTVADADTEAKDIALTETAPVETKTLSTEDMDVYAAAKFPSVVKYEMKKGDLKGKVFYGQTAEINTVKINGTPVELTEDDVQAEFSESKAVYTMTVKDEENKIDAAITAEIAAEKNTLAFNITKIQNNLEDSVSGNPIQTIEIPNHSLVSVRSTQEGANLKGAAMSSNTTISGDEYVEVNDSTPLRDRDYMYAFVSNNELSAGLWSNSENEGRAVSVGVAGGSHNTRIMSTSSNVDGCVSMGLASSLWYYHRVVTDTKGVSHMVEETAMPQAKVIITGDQNGDKKIDWQDGAVAFRTIMNNPYKSEEVPELVAWRIAMNFGGQAQNPFLTTLDNVKRVAMHTDGLGQSVLLKGYGNEGHDSGHPDYADIGERIGGAKDMNTLMTKGAAYGARFGIHVNAGEMYPEAKAFSDELVYRYSNGALKYGWNWIDQGVAIDSIYDVAMGLRESRFDALQEKVGSNMDFVYVDIWGNKTGGSDDSWQTRKLSKEINDNGWRMATEWGSANEYDSTFQHWATDLTYGGYTLKGENSEVMRFLRNHQKDSWVGDYPAYGGAAIAPLLGGYNMKDFEGWQGRNDYDTYITNLYTHDLTTKFIQHYEIVKWVDADTAFTATNSSGKSYTWTPEMEITLKDGDDTLVLERGSADVTDAAYRDRTMTLNGKVIAHGAPSRGDRSNSNIQNGQNRGTETYLLPWNWDPKTGEKVASADEKLYHWNTQGGTTEWELPDSWANLKSVKVYKLTDLGKTDEQTVSVKGGKLELTAEAEIPYVVCKGEEGNLKITWSEGMHIVDAGFNSGNFDAWKQTGDGTAKIAKSQYSNPMMKLSGEVAMTQTLTDLEAGKQYAVLVGVDNRSDAKASMEIKSGDTVLASNYTNRSIAKNYVKAYTHSNSSATVDGTSYFQHMYVFFTAPESSDVTLTLSRAAGEGDTYFDDIRITENDSKNITTNDEGEVVKFEQNFETNVQGIYPFVISGIENVEDNRIHLSELHEPYTQAGWDVKNMDDVIDGKWSIKINGLCSTLSLNSAGQEVHSAYNYLAFQTIPQNFRFEPGVTYNVRFDYQTGWDDIYALAIGSGEYGAKSVNLTPLKMGERGVTQSVEFTMTGDASGNSWFGIYSGTGEADVRNLNGNVANFGGYKDFVLDNLVIERVEETYDKSVLEELIAEAEEFNESEYASEEWKVFEDALLQAKVVLNKDKQSAKDIENACKELKAVMESLKTAAGPAGDDSRDIPLDKLTIAAGSAQANYGDYEGPAEFATDGNTGTYWHTKWGDTNLDNAWFEFTLTEPATVDGLRYLPRPQAGNANGKLLKFNLLVKVEGEDEYRTVITDGTFETASRWQIATFDKVENVTHVKLVPTETAGGSDSQKNCFASAAELRLTGPVSVSEVVDKNGLQQAIDAANALAQDQYTEETWAKVAEKLAEAEAVLANEEATKYDVLLAIANLTDAINDLEAVTPPQPEKADKTELNDLIARYAGLSKDDYTVDSWKVFEAAYANACEVAGDENAVQATVDAAVASLKAAFAGLEKAEGPQPSKVDKSKLEKFYKECLAYYKEAKHSKANWKQYQEVMAEVKAVLGNADATQKEVDSALAKLIEITAKMNAELKNSSDAPKNPTTGQNNVVKTGDTSTPIVWVVTGLAAILAAVLVLIKRRRRA